MTFSPARFVVVVLLVLITLLYANAMRHNVTPNKVDKAGWIHACRTHAIPCVP